MNKIKCKNNYCELIITRRDKSVWISRFSKEDFDIVNSKTWILFKTNRQVYIRATSFHGSIFLHNLIIGKLEEGKFCDHIDGDTLNNTRENLRVVDRFQNGWNMKTRKDNTSGVKGVCFYKNYNNWQARISYKGKRISLGYFKNKKEAINARKEAEREYYGDYSRLLMKDK